jgi:GNAT superfamily N-acetyltransferase
MMENVSDELAVRKLTADEVREHIVQLSDILVDCVAGGASVSFMPPMNQEKADQFWRQVADRVDSGLGVVLVAELSGVAVGTVQLVLAVPENQPHRADVAKMLVHRRARRRGIGGALLKAVEAEALAQGKTLLVLDAVTGGDGERLYLSNNWSVVGSIPNYALYPDGRFCATTYMYKDLSPIP